MKHEWRPAQMDHYAIIFSVKESPMLLKHITRGMLPCMKTLKMHAQGFDGFKR
jgi:hypothetical protein